MLAGDRQARIVDIVRERGSVTTADLMDELDASESTIRRDLDFLDHQRLLTRVHGGATVAHLVLHDQAPASKIGLNASAKAAIAQYARELVRPDDFVYMDGGSSTVALVDAIAQSEATFVTNSLPIAQALLGRNCHVLLLGGTVKPLTEVVVGSSTLEAIGRLNFTIGFFGTNGATPEHGLTTPEYEEAHVKELALRHTMHPYVLCDSSKFGQISPVTFAAFDDATIITESMPQEASYRQFGNIVEVEG